MQTGERYRFCRPVSLVPCSSRTISTKVLDQRMMNTFWKIIRNIGITLLALAVGLILLLRSGDIVNNKLAASGYHDRDFLGYIRFVMVFTVPSLLWLVVFLTTIPAARHVRKQLRYCTGIGFALAILAGELMAAFAFLVRYV